MAVDQPRCSFFALAPRQGPREDLAAGKFLVAAASWAIRTSREAVILLVRLRFEKKARMGLIVNRRTDVPLSRVLEDLKEAKEPRRSGLRRRPGGVEQRSRVAEIGRASQATPSTYSATFIWWPPRSY